MDAGVINLIAEAIDEHPDHVLFEDDDQLLLEWWFSKRIADYFQNQIEKELAELITPEDVKRIQQYSGGSYEPALRQVMKDMVIELRNFADKFKLQRDQIVPAFKYYKQHKQLPPALTNRGRQAENEMYGQDFRGGQSHSANQTMRRHMG